MEEPRTVTVKLVIDTSEAEERLAALRESAEGLVISDTDLAHIMNLLHAGVAQIEADAARTT